jgi:hypothetical protein
MLTSQPFKQLTYIEDIAIAVATAAGFSAQL